ncbi:hypothetical protein BH11PLA2_BH11PLA2_12360 [soil metagenome]
MPTIDKRYLFKLLAITLVLVGVLFGVHTWQARRIPAALQRQAERAVAAGKPDSAIRHLRQYLEFVPDNVEVETQLSELIRNRSGDAARNELHFLYDKILRTDPARIAVRREALNLAVRTGRLGDAVSHAEAILKVAPTDATTWQQLAAAQAGLRLADAAKVSYETALKCDPTDRVAYQRLAQFLAADVKKPAEAKVVVDKMVAALPKDPQAWLTRVRFVLMTEDDKPLPSQKTDAVLADIAKALELAPKNADALLLKAERLQRHRDINGAREALAFGVQCYPAEQRLVRSLAWLEVNRNNMAGAIGVLEDALPHAKDGIELMVPLADLLLDTGDIAKAEAILKSLDKRTGPTVMMQAKYLRSRLAMKAGKWDDAIATLTTLRSEAVNLPSLETQSNLLLSTCYQKKGEPERAIDCLKLITGKDGAHLAAHVNLGQLYLNAGRTNDAIKEYEAAVASPYATPSAFTTYIRIQGLKLAHSDAKPDDWAALEKKLNDLAPRYGQLSAEPARLKAELLMLSGNPKAGVEVLRKEVNRKPQSTALWCSLASAVADTDSIAAGLTVLDEALGFVSDGAELRLARANLYANDPAKLRPLELLENNTETWSDAEQMTFAQGMIEIYDRVGKAAPHLWQKILNRRPNDVETWLAAVWSLRSDNSATKTELYRQALAVVSKSDARLGDYIRILELDGKVTGKELLMECQKAFGERPERAELCSYLAMCEYLNGDEKKGIELFGRAWRIDPLRIETTAAYLYTNVLQCRPADTSRFLMSMECDPRWAGQPFRRTLSAVFNMSRIPESFVKNVEKVIAIYPNGYSFMAELCQRNKLVEAEQAYCQKDVERFEASADRYSRLMKCSPNPEACITAAKAKLPPSSYAQFLASVDAVKPVDVRLLQAIQSVQSEPAFVKAKLAIAQARLDRDLAIGLLDDFLKSKDIVSKDAAWATRNLAMMLVVRGEIADRERAAKLLTETTLQNAGDSLDDQRTTAGVLAGLQKYLDGPARDMAMKRAIELMEAVAKTSGSPKDAFSLCRLYNSAGQPAAAVEKLKVLLASDPGNVDYLLAGLDVLMEAKQLDAAKGFADRLLQLAPGEYRVIAAVSRFKTLNGEYGPAMILAESYLRTADPLVGDVNTKTVKTAELLEQLALMLKRGDEAQQFANLAVDRYEALLPGRAEVVIRIATLMAKTYTTKDALIRVEKHSRVVPSRILATAGVTALGIGGGDAAQFAKVKTWIDSAKKDEPDSVAILLGEAEWLTLKGDYAAAEVAYDAILVKYPHSVPALNNLAWILAAKPESAAKSLALIDRAVKEGGLTGELLDTRARIRLAAKQPAMAAKDAGEALKHAKTPLRYFHLALAFNDDEPEHKDQAKKLFAEAKSRGLTERQIHPADRSAFETLQKAQ